MPTKGSFEMQRHVHANIDRIERRLGAGAPQYYLDGADVSSIVRVLVERCVAGLDPSGRPFARIPKSPNHQRAAARSDAIADVFRALCPEHGWDRKNVSSPN